MRKAPGLGVCIFLLTLLLSFTANGQQITTGVIQGTISDEAGAVVPGADVEVRNLETNLTKTFSTDSDGRFVFLQLQPGRYSLTVTKQGYAKVLQENVSLTIGQTITL